MALSLHHPNLDQRILYQAKQKSLLHPTNKFGMTIPKFRIRELDWKYAYPHSVTTLLSCDSLTYPPILALCSSSVIKNALLKIKRHLCLTGGKEWRPHSIVTSLWHFLWTRSLQLMHLYPWRPSPHIRSVQMAQWARWKE